MLEKLITDVLVAFDKELDRINSEKEVAKRKENKDEFMKTFVNPAKDKVVAKAKDLKEYADPRIQDTKDFTKETKGLLTDLYKEINSTEAKESRQGILDKIMSDLQIKPYFEKPTDMVQEMPQELVDLADLLDFLEKEGLAQEQKEKEMEQETKEPISFEDFVEKLASDLGVSKQPEFTKEPKSILDVLLSDLEKADLLVKETKEQENVPLKDLSKKTKNMEERLTDREQVIAKQIAELEQELALLKEQEQLESRVIPEFRELAKNSNVEIFDILTSEDQKMIVEILKTEHVSERFGDFTESIDSVIIWRNLDDMLENSEQSTDLQKFITEGLVHDFYIKESFENKFVFALTGGKFIELEQ